MTNIKVVRPNVIATKDAAPLEHGFHVCQGKYFAGLIKSYERKINYITSASNKN
jgi:hypothetical protein